MDVLWFRLSRRDTDPAETMGRFYPGGLLVMINRGWYWQCGLVIPKGAHEEIRQRGLPAFRDELARLAPFGGDRAGELRDWEMIRLLAVQVDRLHRWFRPGLLCIGDAAHAMSPVGGVGINLAIQDAVATARFLAAPLREGRLTEPISSGFSDAASCPPASPSGSSSSFRIASSSASSAARRRSRHHWRCGCSPGYPGFAASRPG